MTRNKKKYLVAIAKGAALIVAGAVSIPAVLAGLLFLSRASIRVLFGTASCNDFARYCTREPTLFDKIAVYGSVTLFLIAAAIAVGLRFFYEDDEPYIVSKNWPWPD